ncbi:O-acetyl-ADP-ribose deacetylase [Dethiobacter alkaliphilus]|uniref:Appr-1-p processing domain protein n=1 Tax=Dethiobacter alkaliphilus AHT 1 TaxID=555088 RepID=C0GDH8_DETAL|nr:O-acetyl-ADP-ribose deacetylase [Dethiobacter alkaliphilus]EEG78699.1 Appr-1-p processing domain protein [Dethiobacter alkaliphilus AHT 1]
MEKKEVNKSVIELAQGDITQEETAAIVNAANKELSPGAGVSGAIHKAAGEQLWEDTKKLGGCETGEAKITWGYNLRARYVIHTVGPVYSGSPEDAKLLRSCYMESLKLASGHDAQSVSFPAISTGVFGYPIDEAAKVSLQAVRDYLREHPEIQKVRFVLFGDNDYAAYQAALKNLPV